MPRKNTKQKSKSLCGMCKDYKTAHAPRWEPRQLDKLRRYEREKREYEGKLQEEVRQ